MVLKLIPQIISPDLLHVLASMGHGDEIVLADTFFPTSSICRNGPKEIRADGHNIPELLKAILSLFPLDAYVASPAAVMAITPTDLAAGLNKVDVWPTYQAILDQAEKSKVNIEQVERFAFYERAKNAFAVVHTGERAKYGNIILKKGLVLENS